MTEEQLQNKEQPQTLNLAEESLQQDLTNTQNRAVARLYQFGFVYLTVSAIISLIQFGSYDATQILGYTAGILISILLLRVSLGSYRRGRRQLAYNLIPIVLLANVILGMLFLAGIATLNLINGLLIFSLAALILRPNNRRYWIAAAIFYFAAVLTLNLVQIAPRFEINQSSSWQISLAVLTLIIALFLIWQLFLILQASTIRNRLLAGFVLLGLFSTIITAGTASILSFQRGREEILGSLDLIATIKTNQIDAWINELQINLADLSTEERILRYYKLYLLYPDPDIEPSLRNRTYANISSSLNQPLGESNKFRSFSIVDPDGIVTVSTFEDLEGSDVSDEDYFIGGSQGPYHSPISLNPETNRFKLFISQPMFNSYNQLIGVMVSEANTLTIGQVLTDTSNLGETGESYLVAENRTLLSPLRNSQVWLPGSGKINTIGATAATTDKTVGGATYLNYQGTNVIGNYRWLPSLNAALLIEQSSIEAFAALRLAIFINAAIAIIIITIAVGVAIVLTQSISGPLSSLAETATLIAAGEIELIDPMDRSDEIGELSHALSTMTAQLREFVRNLEQTVDERTQDLERRTRYLEATAEIGRAATGIYELEDLLTTVAHQISEKFGFYHVGLFILDELKEYAVLKAANSEGGWRMLARGHRLRVGEQGVVGYVTGTGQPRIQQQVAGEDSVYYDNPDLPLTRSEMTLPLVAGGELIGALDVQSTEEVAFSGDDVEILQVLADEVAMAISNTLLFQQLQEHLETERRLYGEISQEAWTSILHQSHEILSYRSDELGVHPEPTGQNPDSIRASTEGRIIEGPLSEGDTRYPLYVPVKVRGNVVIAVLETHKPVEDGPWTSQEISVLEAISEQLGIALENARLFEETQLLAQRERIAAEVSGKIWSSSNVDTILQTAVQELGRALNATQGAIRLKLPEEDAPGGKQPQTFGDLEA